MSVSKQSELDALKAIPLLFDRITEPLYKPRDGVVFEIPESLMTERQQPHYEFIAKRISHENSKVIVKEIKNLPDLSEVGKLKRYEPFVEFNPVHQDLASKLIKILTDRSENGYPDADSLLAACVYARERVNIKLYVYAVSVAVLHRDDTKDVTLPSYFQIFPDLYIQSTDFAPIIHELMDDLEDEAWPAVPISSTASDLDIEHRLAYWREDIGLNLHHWHWHLVYPTGGTLPIVNKDRRGELFFYMHQQMIARYNFERFSLRMCRVLRMNNFNDPIPEGYYPNLYDYTSCFSYAARQAGSVLSDLRRETGQNQVILDVNHMYRWRDTILNAIHARQVVKDDNTIVSLEEEKAENDIGIDKGIDILGNMVEASILSPNRNLYGNLHNMGHNLIAYIHDPNNKYLQPIGVMGNNATSMRDPVFYAWHSYIDDIFQTHKELLPPYGELELGFPGVKIDGIKVEDENGNENIFTTYFQQENLDINKGLNSVRRGRSVVTTSHLDHAQFSYNITVDNRSGAERIGTVRIFMAPYNDETSEEFTFQHQRRFFIELDRFPVLLRPGENVIQRHSIDSSVTIPFDQLFGKQMETNYFCKCGWPDYLLIPRGNAEGLQAVLFVMISDGEKDIIQNEDSDSDAQMKHCKHAPEYCGLRDKKYPDRRAMGFPFDRKPPTDTTLKMFSGRPNMSVQKVFIYHKNITVAPLENPKRMNNSNKIQG